MEGISRLEYVAQTLAGLSLSHRNQLGEAADGDCWGGDSLEEPFLSVAVNLNFAYKCTGRLRPDVYNLLTKRMLTTQRVRSLALAYSGAR